jgi:hypothetical protein
LVLSPVVFLFTSELPLFVQLSASRSLSNISISGKSSTQLFDDDDSRSATQAGFVERRRDFDEEIEFNDLELPAGFVTENGEASPVIPSENPSPSKTLVANDPPPSSNPDLSIPPSSGRRSSTSLVKEVFDQKARRDSGARLPSLPADNPVDRSSPIRQRRGSGSNEF